MYTKLMNQNLNNLQLIFRNYQLVYFYFLKDNQLIPILKY